MEKPTLILCPKGSYLWLCCNQPFLAALRALAVCYKEPLGSDGIVLPRAFLPGAGVLYHQTWQITVMGSTACFTLQNLDWCSLKWSKNLLTSPHCGRKRRRCVCPQTLHRLFNFIHLQNHTCHCLGSRSIAEGEGRIARELLPVGGGTRRPWGACIAPAAPSTFLLLLPG